MTGAMHQLLAWFGADAHSHRHGHEELRHRLGDALLDLTLDTAPTLMLGLAIAARIVEAHGGELAVENLQPRGCRFTFYLPFRTL